MILPYLLSAALAFARVVACAPAIDAQAPASPIIIVGRVVDSSGAPIPSAEIRIAGVGHAAYADSLGGFLLPGVPRTVQRVQVRRLGYTPRSVIIDAAASPLDTLVLQIDLVAYATELPKVAVAGRGEVHDAKLSGFYERMRSSGAPMSSFVTREEIERTSPLRTSNIIARRGARAERCLRGLIWIDGALLAPNAQTSGLQRGRRPDVGSGNGIDRLVQPSEIAAIEIYRSPAEIPAEFNITLPGVPTGCAILIWTR